MIHRPKKIQAMWDNWLQYYRGTYYLYYLTMGPTEKQGMHGQGVALSTSRDGVHWDEKGVVLPKDPGATGLGSGSVWKSDDFAQSGKFIMNYSTWFDWCIQSQHIRFAESTDLIHWQKLGPDYAFHADGRWYETYPEFEGARWDCIHSIPRAGGGRYGYWTAEPKGHAGFGFGETMDGRRWTALEPPVIEGVSQGEVGAVEEIGGVYYMLYGGGRQTLLANRPQGPFRLVGQNPALLDSRSAYFTRFFPAPDGLLVNHQSMSLVGIPEEESTHQWATGRGLVWFAPLKRAVVDDQGTLRLGYWEGNDKLKGNSREPAFLNEPSTSSWPVRMLGDRVDIPRGIILEGTVVIPSSVDAPLLGLYIGVGSDRGVAILVGAAGVTEFGTINADGSDFERDDRVDREMVLNQTCQFRLLLRDALLELYVNDILIQCYSTPRVPTGTLGLVVGAQSTLRDLKIWEMDV